jgi:multiple antibiotic resistance protein
VGQALISFFAILDPPGNVLVFHLFTQGLSWRAKLIAAAIATVAAFVMLAVFSLGGEEVLDALGISAESFKVAAGLLLLPPAYRLVMEGQPGPVVEAGEQSPYDFALVPLATPLIAGPGALAATTSFSETVGRETTLAAIAIVLVILFLTFVLADRLFALLGATALRVLSRIVGIMLFALAVDFVLDGLRDFAETNAIFA